MHARPIRRVLAALICCSVAVSVGAQSHETFTNLKVLPKDIAPADLRRMMSGFTRALGVHCVYCHVGAEGRPMRPQDFALDDKPTKRTARAMMRMVKDLNDNYLATLEVRASPPVAIQCVTCHRGATQPRVLQDVLAAAYDSSGYDSTVARYRSLRERYYGRFTYDFGDAPLADVSNQVRAHGHADDANRLLALNVEMNPGSSFAKRQLASASIASAFHGGGADSGAAAYRDFKSRFGATIVTEEMLNDIGYQFLGADQVETAIHVFQLNVADHPGSANAYDSMGEAYIAHGDWKLATEAYRKVLSIDPANENAKLKLDEIKVKSKEKRKGGAAKSRS